jgi:hypothetical protein
MNTEFQVKSSRPSLIWTYPATANTTTTNKIWSRHSSQTEVDKKDKVIKICNINLWRK